MKACTCVYGWFLLSLIQLSVVTLEVTKVQDTRKTNTVYSKAIEYEIQKIVLDTNREIFHGLLESHVLEVFRDRFQIYLERARAEMLETFLGDLPDTAKIKIDSGFERLTKSSAQNSDFEDSIVKSFKRIYADSLSENLPQFFDSIILSSLNQVIKEIFGKLADLTDNNYFHGFSPMENLAELKNFATRNMPVNIQDLFPKKDTLAEVAYIGAVLEYRPYDTWTDDGQGNEVLKTNAKNIVAYAAEAKTQGADILVTPEYGLQSLDMPTNNTEKYLTYTQYVPNPLDRITPCSVMSSSTYVEVLKMLSCGAAENEIYLVVHLAELSICSNSSGLDSPFPSEVTDVCPEAGYVIYSTQVVFDRRGEVIARYRKQNLFLEPYYTPGPKEDKTAIFVTDFNVAFTLQICFDILYEHPGYSNVKQYGIRDVAMSTAWIDELPFDVADGIQNGWSRGLEINLLVAGHHMPEINMLGSGIYRSYSRELPNYVYDRRSGNVLLVSPIQTIAASSLEKVTSIMSSTSQESLVSESTERNFNSFYGHGDTGNILISKSYTDSSNVNVYDIMTPIIHEDLSNYTKLLLSRTEIGNPLILMSCDSDNFCCELTYEYTGNLTYMFVIESGRKPLGNGEYNVGVQICGIVWCQDSDYTSCAVVENSVPDIDEFGPLKIRSSSFKAEVVYPIGILRNLSLISNDHLQFINNFTKYYQLSTEEATEQPLSVALYGRWFSNDL